MGPLSAEALDTILRAKGGPPASWPEVVEVHEASGGNPYFAMELATAMGARGDRHGARQPLPVPGSLLPLVQRRLQALTPAGGEVALLAAAAAAPTVEVVLAACGDDQDAQEGLESAEAAGVLQITGDRVRFTHPLLRSVHYSSATQRRRQQAHRRLAAVTGAAEGQVRHLALAASGPDGHLADRLATAAEDACLRGAAVAGAELADLALRLTPDGHPATRAARLTDAGWPPPGRLRPRGCPRAAGPGNPADRSRAAARCRTAPQGQGRRLLRERRRRPPADPPGARGGGARHGPQRADPPRPGLPAWGQHRELQHGAGRALSGRPRDRAAAR